MIASVFAYNNYRFSKYKFIDFSEILLYEKSEIFTPKDASYQLFIYSSNQSDYNEKLSSLKHDIKILAVDIYQKRADSNENVSFVSSDINTILKLINTLNIQEVPSVLTIARQSDGRYKQDSKIDKF